MRHGCLDRALHSLHRKTFMFRALYMTCCNGQTTLKPNPILPSRWKALRKGETFGVTAKVPLIFRVELLLPANGGRCLCPMLTIPSRCPLLGLRGEPRPLLYHASHRGLHLAPKLAPYLDTHFAPHLAPNHATHTPLSSVSTTILSIDQNPTPVLAQTTIKSQHQP